MKSLFLLIVAFAWLCAPAHAAQDNTAMDHYAAYATALEQGDHETALKEARLAYNLARKEFGRRDKRTGLMASNLGGELLIAEDLQGAKRAFGECITILTAADDRSADLGYCHYYLGIVLEKSGSEELAISAYTNAVAILAPLAPSDQNALALAADASLAQATLAVARDFKKPIRFRSARNFAKKRDQRFTALQELTLQAEALNRDAYGAASVQYMIALLQVAKLSTRYNKLRSARDAYARAYGVGLNLYAGDDPELHRLLALLLEADMAVGAPNTLLIGSRDLGPAPSPIIEGECSDANWPKEMDHVACPLVQYPPRYPNISPYVSGFVVLTFDVLEDGSTTNFSVVESKPDGRFEKAAIRAVEKWNYRPPVDDDGNPITRKDIETMITFEIQGEPVPYRERYCFEFPQGDGVVSTCTISRTLPYYPLSINRIEKTGYALVHYDIRADGRVENVRAPQGWPGDGINQIVREAVETWVYEPPMDSERMNVAITGVETALTFELK